MLQQNPVRRAVSLKRHSTLLTFSAEPPLLTLKAAKCCTRLSAARCDLRGLLQFP